MIVFHEDLCVMCGTVIPEGQMVCPICVQAVEEKALPIPAARQNTVPAYQSAPYSTSRHSPSVQQNPAPDYHPGK